MQDSFARARTRPSARATIAYLVYKHGLNLNAAARPNAYWTMRYVAGLHTRYPIVARAWPL